MEEETTAADEDMVVGSILAEIGINLSGAVPEAPMGSTSQPVTEPIYSAADPQPMAMGVTDSSGGSNPPAAPDGGGDNGLSELEARLNNLRRNE